MQHSNVKITVPHGIQPRFAGGPGCITLAAGSHSHSGVGDSPIDHNGFPLDSGSCGIRFHRGCQKGHYRVKIRALQVASLKEKP